MAAGQPAFYKTPEELQKKIDLYFKDCDEKKVNYTVPGLAVFLGFASRFSIIDYKGRPKFSHTIKKALATIEQQRVEKLLNGENVAAGAIFDLKNNFGYKDKQEIEHAGKDGGPITMRFTDMSDEQLKQYIATNVRK